MVGEMISLNDLSEGRLRATGERLGMRLKGMDVALVDEIPPSTRIVRGD
jgi:hypothetical protein